jgi:hypothetical protein
LAKYYVSLMAYLFYTYCDHNSSTLLPYIKVTYQGNLSLQQEAYWSGKKDEYKKILNENCLKSNGTLSSSSSSDMSSNGKSSENNKNSIKIKKYENNRNHPMSMSEKETDFFKSIINIYLSGKNSNTNLNALAIPFHTRTENQRSTTDNDKTPAQLVLFEPKNASSRGRSCQTVYQRMHHRPREDWDKPSKQY